MKKTLLTFMSLLVLCIAPVKAQIDPVELAKWEGRKYSMFIHWGIYSELGGVWDGKNISRGLSEQIQAHAGIYSDTYENVANSFNPTKWNAEEVALLAKNAGMKSIVFTSKHHDGFCMYHTKTTDFNIVDATPFKRDVLKELADACAKHGLKMSLYYSNIDWHFPAAMPISSHNSDLIPAEHFEFNKQQLKELLTNYGEIAELWFDMGSYTLEQSTELKKWVRSFQPNCMVGGRIGNGQGDFMVMGDNQEPSYIIGVPWQSPASFFHETWSYRSWQDRGSEQAKFKEKLTSLIKVCGRGGNYLLNIGPRGDGSVVEFESDILLKIGQWLSKNGEAVYDTSADPFHKNFEWGSVTAKNNNLYLHILDMPTNGKIILPDVIGNVGSVSVLGEKVKGKHKRVGKNIEINIPTTLDSETIHVVKVAFNKGFEVLPLNITPLTADTKLTIDNGFNFYSHSGVDYNSIYQSTIKQVWTLLPAQAGSVTPKLVYTDQEVGRALKLTIGDKLNEVQLSKANPTTLDNSVEAIKWGDIYMQDGRWSALSSSHGDLNKIDVTKDWGGKWNKTDYKNNHLYSMHVVPQRAYNTVQNINSPKDQQVLISVSSGDGVVIALNGKQLLTHGNLEKDNVKKDVILLDLKEGNNTLYVMYYNRFRNEMSFSIDTNISQTLYSYELEPISITKGKYLPVSWKVDNKASIHETINIPNLKLIMNEK